MTRRALDRCRGTLALTDILRDLLIVLRLIVETLLSVRIMKLSGTVKILLTVPQIVGTVPGRLFFRGHVLTMTPTLYLKSRRTQ